MTLPSVKFTPDPEDRSGAVPCLGIIDEQPPCPSSASSSRPEEGTAPPVLAVGESEQPVWVDLLRPNRELLWVEVLARRVEEIIRMPQDGQSLNKQELKVILTEAEKQTVLIGKRFALADFAKVDLSRAVFREADLEGAKFVQTDLRGANFHQANVQGAVFSFCDLYEADFTGARLEGANFLTSFGLSPVMWGYIRSHGGVV